jgi:hypothetical protein
MATTELHKQQIYDSFCHHQLEMSFLRSAEYKTGHMELEGLGISALGQRMATLRGTHSTDARTIRFWIKG